MAMRLRSRAVICTMGSSPRSCSRCATALGSTPMRARGDSVRLTASTQPFSSSALANRSDRSMPLGGVSSVVTTKAPERSFCSSGVILIASLCSEALRHALHRARHALHDVVYLVAGDHQRRREAEDVPMRQRASDDSFFDAG